MRVQGSEGKHFLSTHTVAQSRTAIKYKQHASCHFYYRKAVQKEEHSLCLLNYILIYLWNIIYCIYIRLQEFGIYRWYYCSTVFWLLVFVAVVPFFLTECQLQWPSELLSYLLEVAESLHFRRWVLFFPIHVLLPVKILILRCPSTGHTACSVTLSQW